MDAILDYSQARLAALFQWLRLPQSELALAFLVVLLLLDVWRRGWRLSWTRSAVVSCFTTVTIFHINFFFVPFVYLMTDRTRELYAALHIPAIPDAVWSGTPAWALALVAIVAHDFANYWNHRVMHMRWLWPVHAIHHSDPEVNGLTSYRVHVLEGLVRGVSYVLLLSWLGLPADAATYGAVMLGLHNIYVHIDVDWDHGPFKLLLASPRFHRWHHADVPAAYGKNLANVFPVFDWAFGTYRVPGPCIAPMGAQGIPQDNPLKLTLWPFIAWAAMIADRIEPASRRQRLQGASDPVVEAGRER